MKIIVTTIIVSVVLAVLVSTWRANSRYVREQRRRREQLLEDVRTGKRSWMSIGATQMFGDWS
jgi:type II secretory pathway pseudopilin PulG